MKAKVFIPAFPDGEELYFMFSLLEYDGIPILFVCSDCEDNWYLCDCVEFRDYQRWTISRTSAAILSDILNQTLSVFDALSAAGECRVAELNYETEEYRQKTVPFICLGEAELPQKGFMLRYHDVKAEEYVAMLNALSMIKEAGPAASVSFGETNTVRQYECESVPLETGNISYEVCSADGIACYNNAENGADDYLPNLALAA